MHTGEQARKVSIYVNFLQEGDKYLAQIYRDGDNAGYENDTYERLVDKYEVTFDQTLTFNLGRSGGAIVRFIK